MHPQNGSLRCPGCGETTPVVDGIPQFPVPDGAAASGDPFDRLAPIYETPAWFQPLYRFVGGPFAPRDDRARIAELLSGGDGDLVLDVACGTGRFARYLAADGADVLGVDVSRGMLERARRYAERDGMENATFARMSADRLWVADDAVDRAACCWAIHLFDDPAAALAELHRVLRPGGRFAGSTIVDRYVAAVPGVRAVARRTIGAEPFAPDAFRDLLREAGFGEIEFDRRGAALFFGARAE